MLIFVADVTAIGLTEFTKNTMQDRSTAFILSFIAVAYNIYRVLPENLPGGNGRLFIKAVLTI